MAHLELGQDRLAPPHPLQAFELAQRSVQSPLEARFVAEQAIESGAIRHIATHYFQLRSRGLNRGACLLIALDATNLFVDFLHDDLATCLRRKISLAFALFFRSLS